MLVNKIRTIRYATALSGKGLMFINDPPRPRTRKELKVNLPAHQHLRLRELQAVSGREAPTLVAEALGLYFSMLSGKTSGRAEDGSLSASARRTTSYPLR